MKSLYTKPFALNTKRGGGDFTCSANKVLHKQASRRNLIHLYIYICAVFILPFECAFEKTRIVSSLNLVERYILILT